MTTQRSQKNIGTVFNLYSDFRCEGFSIFLSIPQRGASVLENTVHWQYLSGFKNVLNARIRLPVNFEAENRNLLVKVTSFKNVFDIPDSITVLPDAIPILVDLMKRRYSGTLNLTNPGPICHSETLGLYQTLVRQLPLHCTVENCCICLK